MASRKFWMGMLVIVLTFGLMVAGCGGDSDSGGSGGNSITITGITGKTGDANIIVASDFNSESGLVAAGMGTISGSSVTFKLVKDEKKNPWTGNGSYYLMLGFDQDESEYFYTNGQTISISSEDEDFYGKLPKYNITSASSTIAFNLFKVITLTVDSRPDLTGTVSIDNTSPKVGDTLTAAYSGGNGTGTATYQWIQGDSTNVGTNSNTYTVTAADEGKTIKVQVSFANQINSVTSTATAAAQGGALSLIKLEQILQAIQNDASFNGTLDLSSYTRTTTSAGALNTSGSFSPSNVNTGKGKVKTIILPDAAVSIASNVFTSSGGFTVLESVTGANITSIGTAFSPASTTLKSVVFTKVTSIPNDAFNGCTALETAQFVAATSIGNNAFKGCAKLKTIDFSAATSIGTNTFENCAALITVTFPKVTTLGGNAFLNCANLDHATFPLATTVGGSAFEDCAKLARVDLNSVTSIGASAFNGAGRQFRPTTIFSSTPGFDVHLGKTPPKLGTSLFGNTSSLGATYVRVYIPDDADTSVYAPDPFDDGKISGTDQTSVWLNGFRGAGWDGTKVTTAGFRNSNVTILITYDD